MARVLPQIDIRKRKEWERESEKKIEQSSIIVPKDIQVMKL